MRPRGSTTELWRFYDRLLQGLKTYDALQGVMCFMRRILDLGEVSIASMD